MKLDKSERQLSNPVREHSKPAPAMTSANMSLASFTLYILLLLVLHFLRSDVNPVDRTISEYAVGPYGSLMTLAFFAFSAGILALAIGLYRGLPRAARSTFGLILLVINGLCVVLVGLFPTDLRGAAPTTSGGIHILASLVAFPSLVLAILLSAWRFKNDENWRPLFPSAWALGFVVLALFISYFTTATSDFAGLTQRFFIAGLLIWLIRTAAHLRSVTSRLHASAE